MMPSSQDDEALRLALDEAERARDEAVERLQLQTAASEGRRLEDQHHLRNMLAVIRAMARRTGDEVTGVDDYVALLDGRLAAYIQVQATIARDGQVDLETLIADELLRFGLRIGEDAELVGAPVAVTGQAGGLLALVFHELAADLALQDGSVPHGALLVEWVQVPDGSLTVDWRRPADRGTAPRIGEQRWPAWLQQALEHQLTARVVLAPDDAEPGLTITLPPACCRKPAAV